MATQVVGLIQQWGLNIVPGGTTGTRVYVDAAVKPNNTPVDLPNMYAPWDVTYWPYLLVSSIDIRYISDDDSCGKIYTVNYSTKQGGFDYVNNVDDLQQSLEQSAEFQTYSDNKATTGDHWIWTGGARANELKFINREITTVFAITRKFTDAKLSDFIEESSKVLGKVNEAVWEDIPERLALYTGASVTQGTSPSGEKEWTATMKFIIKCIDGVWAANNGWNKVFNPKTLKYDIPTKGGLFLYADADFKDLLSVGTSSSNDVAPIIVN